MVEVGGTEHPGRKIRGRWERRAKFVPQVCGIRARTGTRAHRRARPHTDKPAALQLTILLCCRYVTVYVVRRKGRAWAVPAKHGLQRLKLPLQGWDTVG